jgi:arabinofuranosyltransferase
MNTFLPTKTTVPLWVVPCLIAALCLLLGIVIVKAFVLEDAFIVFRSVQNFHNGYFFSALPDVRSQSFTSNLWTLLLLLGGYVSSNLPNVAIALSLACTLGTAVLMLMYNLQRQRPDLSILGLLLLALCNSFTDYSTGGLENPLSHLLLASFIVYLGHTSWKKLDFFILCLIAGSLIANRYDQALLVLPTLTVVFLVRQDWQQDIKRACAGFAPLWLWMSFAWFYYGSIFPDTYFAKMHTGVPVLDRANLALLHHLRMMDLDFSGMILMLTAIGATLLWLIPIILTTMATRKNQQPYQWPSEANLTLGALGTGIIAYNLYFFYAGGDFMAGRFMSIIMLTAVWVLLLLGQQISGRRLVLGLVVFTALCGAKQLRPHLFVPGHGVGSDDEIVRAMTFDYRLFAQDWYFLQQNHDKKDWQQLGFSQALAADTAPYPTVYVDVSAGIIPYYAGPRHKLIDTLGLSDPLLSRLPCTILGAAAHCIRNVPAGYADFVATGKTENMDSDLAAYVIPLFQIKTLPLFSAERIKILFAFSLGQYDSARKSYNAKHANEFYQPREGAPMFRHAYGETILAPWLGARNGQTTANPMRW